MGLKVKSKIKCDGKTYYPGDEYKGKYTKNLLKAGALHKPKSEQTKNKK